MKLAIVMPTKGGKDYYFALICYFNRCKKPFCVFGAPLSRFVICDSFLKLNEQKDSKHEKDQTPSTKCTKSRNKRPFD